MAQILAVFWWNINLLFSKIIYWKLSKIVYLIINLYYTIKWFMSMLVLSAHCENDNLSDSPYQIIVCSYFLSYCTLFFCKTNCWQKWKLKSVNPWIIMPLLASTAACIRLCVNVKGFPFHPEIYFVKHSSIIIPHLWDLEVLIYDGLLCSNDIRLAKSLVILLGKEKQQ